MDTVGLSCKTHWQSAAAAAAYRHSRQPETFKRYHQEQAILTGWLQPLARASLILDIPCGTGRFVSTILDRGLRYIGADISCPMIKEAIEEASRQTHGPRPLGFLAADAELIPLADNTVDCVIIWRLLHHIRDERARRSILREAARVSRRQVIVSFHHPLSFTAFRKQCQRLISGGPPSAAITQWQLRREASPCGLELVEACSFRKYVSINWFARLEKLPPHL